MESDDSDSTQHSILSSPNDSNEEDQTDRSSDSDQSERSNGSEEGQTTQKIDSDQSERLNGSEEGQTTLKIDSDQSERLNGSEEGQTTQKIDSDQSERLSGSEEGQVGQEPTAGPSKLSQRADNKKLKPKCPKEPKGTSYTIGIRKINVDAVICKMVPSSPPREEQIIDCIISYVNSKVTEKCPQYQIHEQSEETTDAFHTGQLCLGGGKVFCTKIYKQRVENLISILNDFKGNETTADVEQKVQFNIIVFYYRVDSIFALPFEDAWTHLEWCLDYTFPWKISRRILKAKRRKTTEQRLTGDVSVSSKTFKTPQKQSKMFLPQITTNFVGSLRPKSSLFDDQLNINWNKTSKAVEVGAAFFKFCRPLTKFDYCTILDHLCKIDNGEKTYQNLNPNNNPVEEMDIDDHDSNFIKVPNSIKSDLNNQLVKTMVVYLKGASGDGREYDESHKVLQTLDFSHPKKEEYVKASSYVLQKNKKQVTTFSEPPTLVDVLTKLNFTQGIQKIFQKELNKITDKEWEKIKNYIGTFKFSFYVGNWGKEYKPVMQCVEGLFSYNCESYWRHHGFWFQISVEYHAVVHREFINLLRDTLIEEQSTSYLPHRWLNEAQQQKSRGILKTTKTVEWENYFNKSFNFICGKNGSLRFIIGDKKLAVGKVEMFDIAQAVEKGRNKHRMYLYHVKKGFDNMTRVACLQIINAAKILHGVLSNSKKDRSIEGIYNDVKETVPNFLTTFKLENYEKFVQFFKGACFVYVFIDGKKPKQKKASEQSKFNDQTKSIHRSMQLEKETKLKLGKEDLKLVIRNHFKGEDFLKLCKALKIKQTKENDVECSECTQKLYELLRVEYINNSNYPTTKFLYCPEDGFRLGPGIPKNVAKKVWKALSEFRSSFTSTMVPKLSVLLAAEEVKKLGFGFRIHEVLVDDKKLLPDHHKKALKK